MVYAGPYPIPGKRFYKMETLSNAVEKCLQEKDRFIWAGLKSAVNESSLASVVCDLVYEDAVRLVFSVTLATPARKNVHLRLVVAKNHEECSAAINKECATLAALHERNPQRVVPVAERGVIYLPDRHMRREINREVSAYMYKSPAALTPLYVASSSQLGPRGAKPLRFSLKETETLRKSIVGLLAGCYDEKSFTGVDPKDLTPECFAVQSPGGDDAVLLVQCPRLRKRMPPGQLVQKLIFGTLGTGATRLAIAPTRPADFFQALARTVSPEKARKWCSAFISHQKTHAEDTRPERDIDLPGRDYFEILAEEMNG